MRDGLAFLRPQDFQELKGVLVGVLLGAEFEEVLYDVPLFLSLDVANWQFVGGLHVEGQIQVGIVLGIILTSQTFALGLYLDSSHGQNLVLLVGVEDKGILGLVVVSTQVDFGQSFIS